MAAITITDGNLAIDATCMGCGLCVTACPTDALQWPRSPRMPATETRIDPETLVIACRQAPGATRKDAIRVDCLGALDAGALAEFVAYANGRPLELPDAELCTGCPRGAAAAGIAVQVEGAIRLLADVGVPATALPRRRDNHVRSTPHRAATRRSFLGRVLQERLEATGSARCAPGARPIAPLRQRRLAAALRTLAARHGRAVLPPILGEVVVSEACAGHGVCATACPTGALRLVDDGIERQLRFTGIDCTGCGDCVRSCPSGAIRLRPAQRGDAAERTLARRALALCTGCDDSFVDEDMTGLCPACRKDGGLFAALTNARDPAAGSVAVAAAPDTSGGHDD